MLLGEGPMRFFNELRHRVGGISPRMLTLTVRGLERDDFVTRTLFPWAFAADASSAAWKLGFAEYILDRRRAAPF